MYGEKEKKSILKMYDTVLYNLSFRHLMTPCAPDYEKVGWCTCKLKFFLAAD